MTMISGGGAPSFQIGPSSPTHYARFATTSTPSWGSALSQIGGAFAERHNRERMKEAKLAEQAEQTTKRQGWMQSLGAGATLRDVAASDPSVLGDTDFIKFVHSTKAPKGFTDVHDDEGNILGQRGPDNRWYDDPRAAPALETFEIADDPYGRGGIGQRSSTTGKLVNYQGPLAPEGPAAATFEDVLNPYGFGGAAQRSSTTGELTGYRAAPSQPEADAPPSLKDQLQMVRSLSDDWQKVARPMQGLLDQSDRMEIGLRMAQGGDMLAGSQAILISFNKLLDPTSVVRESEYARSASGQSALETLRGFVDKLSKGGAGVTLAELQSYARFGEQVVQRALESTVGPERERISRLVEFAGVDPELIFSGRFAPQAVEQVTAPGSAPNWLDNSEAVPSIAAIPRVTGGMAADEMTAAPRADPSRLAQALIGTANAAGAAPVGVQPEDDPARISMYADLTQLQLKRQIETMKANEGDYSDAEKRAAALAWQQAFPGQ